MTNAAIAPDGSVYLVDFTNQDIRVFDREGRFLHTIGRRGEGPGEFQGPVSLDFDPRGRLWVADAFNHRYTVFLADGTVASSTSRPFTTIAGWQQQLAFVGHGTFVDEIATRDQAGRATTGFVLVDTAGVVLDTLPPLPPVSGFQVGGPAEAARLVPAERALRPYLQRSIHTLAPPRHVWSGRSDRYEIARRTLTGDTALVIRGPARDYELSRDDRSVIAEALRGTGVDASDLPLGRQFLQSLIALEDGHLLVQVEGRPGRDSPLFDIFAPDGQYVGELRLPFAVDPRPNAGIRGDTLVLIGRDELDVHYAWRVVLKRSGAPMPAPPTVPGRGHR